MEHLYAQADLVIFPSVWDEPFGLVGIEAMAHGVPVVAFDVGGVREWLTEGVGGWCVPRKDVDAMALAIDTALSDPDLRREVGEAGRQRVERDFRPQGYYNQLEALLQACAASPGSDMAPAPAQT
jgi:glycosyltransferase involved in cell wall biosynthesis